MAASSETSYRFDCAEQNLMALERILDGDTGPLTAEDRAHFNRENELAIAEFNAAYADMEAEGWY